MTRSERRRREAVALLIAVGERNDDVRGGLEAERDCLLTQGSLIASPAWRQPGRGPRPRSFIGHTRRSRRVEDPGLTRPAALEAGEAIP
jgi:hypothetical protein